MDYSKLTTTEYLKLIVKKIQAIFPSNEFTLQEVLNEAEKMNEEDVLRMEINLKAFLGELFGNEIDVPLSDRKAMIDLIDVNGKIQLN